MLAVNNITMQFGGLVALDSVNMTVQEGEIRGLIGPNGSGKTTMINVITGFYAPTKGTVEMDGAVISGKTSQCSGQGRSLQDVPEHQPVFRNDSSGKRGDSGMYASDCQPWLCHLPDESFENPGKGML